MDNNLASFIASFCKQFQTDSQSSDLNLLVTDQNGSGNNGKDKRKRSFENIQVTNDVDLELKLALPDPKPALPEPKLALPEPKIALHEPVGSSMNDPKPLTVFGCVGCYMYVMVSPVNPRCPKCKTADLIDVLGETQPAKRARMN